LNDDLPDLPTTENEILAFLKDQLSSELEIPFQNPKKNIQRIGLKVFAAQLTVSYKIIHYTVGAA
jgi:predicted DNA-binding protein (MmcQ/YjbR family)